MEICFLLSELRCCDTVLTHSELEISPLSGTLIQETAKVGQVKSLPEVIVSVDALSLPVRQTRAGRFFFLKGIYNLYPEYVIEGRSCFHSSALKWQFQGGPDAAQ